MESDKSKRITRNTFYLYFRMLIVMLVTLYMSRVLLKVLGVEDFGINNVVGSVVIFLSFFQSALTNATYRYIAYELGTGNQEKLTKVYSMAINCHLILALTLYLIMEVAGVWFINNKMNIDPSRLVAANWLFQFSLITFLISIIRTPFNSNIIAHEKMNFYAFISIAEALLKLLMLFLLMKVSCDKLILYGGLMTFVAFIVFLGYFLYCKLYIKETKFAVCWDNKIFKEFTSYSGWSLFVNAADVSTQQSISVFFNLFVGVIGNAALGITNQVIAGLNMFVSNFSAAFNPQLIKSYASKNYEFFMNLIYSASKISYILYIIVAIPIVSNVNFVLRIWLGDYPPMAADFISVVVIYYMIDSLQSPLFQAVHATGLIKTHHLIVGTIKFLVIPCIYFTLKIGLGPVVALLIWASSNIIVSIARTIYMKKLISLNIKKYLLQVIVPLVFVTLISCGITYLLVNVLDESWYRFIVVLISSSLLILALCYRFVFNNKEKELLFQLPILNKINRTVKKHNLNEDY